MGEESGQQVVVLFEGASDRLAFAALARRRDEPLDGVMLSDLDGITNLRTRLSALRTERGALVLGLHDAAETEGMMRMPSSSDAAVREPIRRVLGRPSDAAEGEPMTRVVDPSDATVGEPMTRVLGLYDAAEGAYVARVLRDLGVIDPATGVPADGGFFGCERDLEDEVIRAAGVPLVEEALAARGELGRFRVFQGQPAQRGKAVADQLHRFAGTAAGRKARFAADIVELLPLDRMPPALSALLAAVRAAVD
ncbi:hypothetical protein [Microbacterium sp. p3-SID336]|uniref:hypothetical protein n=1 Tax=Microbacterium sp. p3-SID336 TaxID=2916212 RepID=UPI0021A3A4AD|nr:hypothetical protein [Microbacterium sp. p3-SID336]MCT1479599.1 hypothetical protein [Microbacterium sp. p3-SID336]